MALGNWPKGLVQDVYDWEFEGFNSVDILRYLRHEMGHVVNYAYKLYNDETWVKVFGSITQPYREARFP